MDRIFPMKLFPVQGASPQTTNGGINGDYISLKNAHRVRIEVDLTQAVGHATAVSLYQATKVDGTGEKALAKSVQIWANEDTAAADTITRQTDGVSHTVANDVKNKKVVFLVEPHKLDLENGFDCLCAKIADSSQATNFGAISYMLEAAYAADNQPSSITD